MNAKSVFVEKLKARTKKLAVDVIRLCDALEGSRSVNVICNQLIKSSSSVGANYRASCRARSKAEFFSKLCIVVEEADETEYWLEIIEEINISKSKSETSRLLKEVN